MLAIVEVNIGENIPIDNMASTTTYCTPFYFGDDTWGVIKDEVTEKYLSGEVIDYTLPVDKNI